MDKLTEMVTSYYPMSTASQIVFSNSIKSFQMQSNTILDYESQDFSRVPVFVGRLLSKMEENGIKIISLSDPDGTFTYRHRTNLDEFSELPDYGFKEEEITHTIQEDIIKSFQGKELHVFTIIPYIDKNDRAFSCYMRMKKKIAGMTNTKKINIEIDLECDDIQTLNILCGKIQSDVYKIVDRRVKRYNFWGNSFKSIIKNFKFERK